MKIVLVRLEMQMTKPTSDGLNPYHAKVIRFIDGTGTPVTEFEGKPFSLLISAGLGDGAAEKQRVMVFELGEEIVDPDTGESLGRFEIVKGEGRISSLQSRMSVIRSERTVLERKNSAYNALLGVTREGTSEYHSVPAPFRNPKIGDLVRFI